jgi:hypothetical protein
MLIILAQKYKYLNNFALIHLYHLNSTSKDRDNNENYYLSILFCGNTLFDYYINNNPKDIELFIHYYSLFENAFDKGKRLFPELYNFLVNKIITNEFLSYEQKEYFRKKILLKQTTSEYLQNFEYEMIYNYQISIFKANNSNRIYKSEPKISIIIFCTEYNHLDKTIHSIQNQNFTFYEIILIYDNKEQNDVILIEKFSKENPNINVINNKNKKGLIYSISIGVLSSKGKYILILEPSNTLINNQDSINKNSLVLYKCHHFKSEINLEAIKYNKNYKNIDQQKDLLINKLIKSDLFKNKINEYNLNEIQREVYNYYDNIFLYILEKSNNIFNQTNIFGIIKNINNTNTLNISNIIEDKEQKVKDSIFYINFLLENSNTFEETKFALDEYFNVMNIIYNKFNENNTESYILYIKFMNNHYITQFDKHYLQFYYNSLIN